MGSSQLDEIYNFGSEDLTDNFVCQMIRMKLISFDRHFVCQSSGGKKIPVQAGQALTGILSVNEAFSSVMLS